MEYKTLITSIPLKTWKDYERALSHAHPEYDKEEQVQYTTFAMVGALTEFTKRVEESYPYETLPARGGGWLVCYCEENKEPRVTDSHPEPFPEKQKSNADRLRKSLNRKWHKAGRETEENMEANNGALIM